MPSAFWLPAADHRQNLGDEVFDGVTGVRCVSVSAYSTEEGGGRRRWWQLTAAII